MPSVAPDPNVTQSDPYFGEFVEKEIEVEEVNEDGQKTKIKRKIGGWPIGLGTISGTYTYMLNIRNLGQYNDDGSLGRIWGGNSSHSSSDTIIKAAAEDSNCSNEERGWGTNGYACAYQVNIKSPVYCQDYENKTWLTCADENGVSDLSYCPPACDCPDCPPYCRNYLTGELVPWPNNTAEPEECIPPDPHPPCDGPCLDYCWNCITGEKVEWPDGEPEPDVCICKTTSNPTMPEFNHIPTGNVNPNKTTGNGTTTEGRKMGINWYDGDNPSTFLELKAYATIKEIEEDQETIYDVSFDNVSQPSNVNNDYALIVRLKGNTIRAIKQYNAEHAAEGYANDSLTCYDYKKNGEETYKDIFCYSDLIDILAEFEDDVKFTKRRPSTQSERETKSDYWTTWDEVGTTHSSWSINTGLLLESQKSYKNDKGIGPAWK